MLRSKLTIAGSNFIFEHINNNYNEYLNKKNKLKLIFRGINIDYFNQKNVSMLKQEKLKAEWLLEPNNFTILMPGRRTFGRTRKFIESLNILIEDFNITNLRHFILFRSRQKSLLKKLLVLREI